MKTESKLFIISAVFFAFIAAVYAYFSKLEPVGSAALLLVALLAAMIGGYFWMLAKRIDPRPEDNPLGEIADGSGDQGAFAPWSWWPLVLGIATSLVFLGLAVGWWIFGVGVVVGVLGLVGWVFEFSRGQHAH